ncbi:MAG: hypothetical protein ACXAC7_06010 [Candidatus Hodarchaeales archaeon]
MMDKKRSFLEEGETFHCVAKKTEVKSFICINMSEILSFGMYGAYEKWRKIHAITTCGGKINA